MTKKELKEYLVETCGYSQEEVDNMSDRDLFDKYLCYEGIIGWTDTIIELTECLNFDE